MPMVVKASAGRAAYLRRAAAILVTLRKRRAEIATLRKAAIIGAHGRHAPATGDALESQLEASSERAAEWRG